jgi:ABC-type uncharacterized transport system substrate-binding protein
MIDYRWAGGDADRIRLYATELTGMRPDVIWTSGALPLLPLKATRTIPIIFTQIYDPVGSGFVASLARPGGNITVSVAVAKELGHNNPQPATVRTAAKSPSQPCEDLSKDSF